MIPDGYTAFTIEKTDKGDTIAHIKFYAGIGISLSKIREFKAITDPQEKQDKANEFAEEVLEFMRGEVLDVLTVRADEVIATADMNFDHDRIH